MARTDDTYGRHGVGNICSTLEYGDFYSYILNLLGWSVYCYLELAFRQYQVIPISSPALQTALQTL